MTSDTKSNPSLMAPKLDSSNIFENLFTQLDDAVFVKDLNGCYVTINPKTAELLGRPQEQILGYNDCDLFSKEDGELIMAQDRKILESGNHVSLEENLTFNNKKIILWTTKIPMHDSAGRVCGLIGIARDITERTNKLQQYVDALRQSEERLRILFEGIDDAVLVHDENGNILDCNQAVCSRLGYSKSEILNLRTVDIDAPRFAEGFKTRLASQVATGRLRCEGVHLTKDGREIFVDIVTSVIDFKGSQAVLAVIRDISDLKRAESERRSLELQIQHAQKLESLGVLAGGIAHDFNNLLMGILGNADLALLHLPADSSGRQEINGIQLSAKRAAELCQQLLAYSGKGHFVVQPIKINDLVTEMAKLLEITISKKVKITYDLKEKTSSVEADITQLRQVVMNLITNAADAIGDNTGIITISTDLRNFTRRELSSLTSKEPLIEGNYVVFEVTDTGPGMEAAVRERIFEPFFTTKKTGRGLGLSAVLGIIRGHKGAIKVDSKVGRGTKISLLFPPSSLPGTALESINPIVKWRGNGIVLLADDEEIVRTVTASMLEAIGFSVITAHDGHAALEMFRKHSSELACIILDLSMPKLSGQETLSEIRKLNKEVAVILSSGYSAQEVPVEAGPNAPGFIQKPYQLEGLRAKLQEVLDR